jgi:hypothetical protein
MERRSQDPHDALHKARAKREAPASLTSGRSQLSIVEHAWFPLDPSIRGEAFRHRASFPIYRPGKRVLTAEVEVDCPRGMKPYDEFVFHGLLSLALAEPNPSPVYYATTNFVLTRLGLNNGGVGYNQLHEAMSHLESATYRCENFFHPIQAEVVKYISFGFVKRCIPLENEAERGWKFVFDTQFFEFARHAYGSLRFPFDLYAQFDPAARRLFLFLRKLFHRQSQTYPLDLDRLSDGILGYDPTYKSWHKKDKVVAAASQLLASDVIALPPATTSLRDAFRKVGKGKYTMVFHRGCLGQGDGSRDRLRESSQYNMLRSLKLSERALREVVDTCPSDLLNEWIQITLAAKERGLIRTTPAAYFLDNIRQAQAGKRTPPDWWRELQRAEDRRQWEQAGAVLRSHLAEQATARGLAVPTFQEYMRTEAARAAFHRVVRDLCQTFDGDASLSAEEQRELAQNLGTQHMRCEYRKAYPEAPGDGPSRLGDILGLPPS